MHHALLVADDLDSQDSTEFVKLTLKILLVVSMRDLANEDLYGFVGPVPRSLVEVIFILLDVVIGGKCGLLGLGVHGRQILSHLLRRSIYLYGQGRDRRIDTQWEEEFKICNILESIVFSIVLSSISEKPVTY